MAEKQRECHSEWSVKVEAKMVTVTHKVYSIMKRNDNYVRNMMVREGRCNQGSYYRCNGNCDHCMCAVEGKTISYDALSVANSDWLVDKQDVAEQVAQKDLIERIYDYSDMVIKDGAAILKMTFIDQCFDNEIAEKLGLDYRTVRRRRDKLLNLIRIKFADSL